MADNELYDSPSDTSCDGNDDDDRRTTQESDTNSDGNDDDDLRTNQEILDDFCAEWISEIDKDVKRSLDIFLCNVFVKYHGMQYTAVKS